MTNRFPSLRAALVCLAVPALLSACEKDMPPPAPVTPTVIPPIVPPVVPPIVNPADTVPRPDTVNLYVVCQGNFGRANAGVTHYNRQTGAVVRDRFAAANPGVALGDVAQSMTIVGDTAYIVVNNSNRITVVRRSDFRQIEEITGLEQPRYLAVFGGKGYVTEWGSTFGAPGRVSELDLMTSRPTGRTFVTGIQPEEIIATPTGLLVANSGSSFLTVILPATASTTIVPTSDGPTALRLDRGGRVWVLCAGRIAYTPTYDIDTAASTAGALVSLPLTNLAAGTTRQFTRKGTVPTGLALGADSTKLYYSYHGNTFEISTTATTLPRTAFIPRAFDAFGVDPQDGTLYGADQRGFTADGEVRRYRPTGAFINSFPTAIGPTQFVF